MNEQQRPENRRQELLDAALEAFVERGYEGTSVAYLAEATGMSKAAFVYHFSSKEDLLFELSAPLLDDLDAVVERHGRDRHDQADVGDFVSDYLDALWGHRTTAAWIDGDKSVLNHGDIGSRIEHNNQQAHSILTGPRLTAVRRAQASALLGMLWRPIRNGYLTSARHKQAVAALVTKAAVNL